MTRPSRPIYRRSSADSDSGENRLVGRTSARVAVVLAGCLLLTVVATGAVTAQGDGDCPAGQQPELGHEFTALVAAVGSEVGDPIECEHPESETGDIQQRTSSGLLYWRKTTDTPTFTNGAEHWAIRGGQTLHWISDSVDPPADSSAAVAGQPPEAPAPAQVPSAEFRAVQPTTPNTFPFYGVPPLDAELALALALAVVVGLMLVVTALSVSRRRHAPATPPADGWPGDLFQVDIFQQVVNLVEPLTRFDRSWLEQGETITQSVAVTARQIHTVSFRADQTRATGRLSSSVRKVSSAQGLAAEMTRLTAVARGGVGARLEAWRNQVVSPLAQLEPAVCFGGVQPIGYEHTCANCGGKGHNTCGNCGGRRQVTCSACSNGKVRCSDCSGEGDRTCRTCGGSGRHILDGRGNYESCFACSGRGSTQCTTCNGSKQVTHWTCHGTGSVTCSTCGGQGTTSCASCAATGWLSETAALRCYVAEHARAESASGDPEVDQLVAGLPTMVAVCELASLAMTNSYVRDCEVERQFSGTMLTTTLALGIVDSDVDIIGYGDRQRVFDFKNVVGLLLQQDLERLTAALAAAPRLPLFSPRRLTDALHNFLLSEVNEHVAGATSRKPRKGQPAKLPTDNASISPEYIAAASAAVRKAVGQVFYASAWPITMLVFAAPIAVFVIGDVLWLWPASFTASLVFVLAVAVGAYLLVVAPWLVLIGLRLRFGSSVGPPLLKIVGRAHAVRNWSLLNALPALIASTGVVLAVWLPPVDTLSIAGFDDAQPAAATAYLDDVRLISHGPVRVASFRPLNWNFEWDFNVVNGGQQFLVANALSDAQLEDPNGTVYPAAGVYSSATLSPGQTGHVDLYFKLPRYVLGTYKLSLLTTTMAISPRSPYLQNPGAVDATVHWQPVSANFSFVRPAVASGF